ncbi:unnamed protein product [Dovyalis caffra]|uniref:Peroxidase n=1 Tax=Dovyalis caffra TaxID=77055 RepID=A0AAV1S8U4_9ROSI|nr:unnamed protein product [Dovyalis caffra]
MPVSNKLKAFAAALFIVQAFSVFGVPRGQLQVGFYSQTCPAAESIVRIAVQNAFSNDQQIAARLLRLFFHDCFVEGCDGSILLDNGSDGERSARGNAGLAGFEVIENVKTQLEATCPGLVSCADIVALAARDAVVLSDGPPYEVPTGRRDGRVSSISLAANLPDVDDSIELLKSKFREKGLTDHDLVLLSGGKGDSDPAINSQLLPQLQAKCPSNGDVDVRLPLDWTSEFKFDDQIFRNIKNGFAVIASDARLCDDKNTNKILDSYISFARSSNIGPSFKADFAEAMVRMGNIGVKTGSEGEIRQVCISIN